MREIAVRAGCKQSHGWELECGSCISVLFVCVWGARRSGGGGVLVEGVGFDLMRNVSPDLFRNKTNNIKIFLDSPEARGTGRE